MKNNLSLWTRILIIFGERSRCCGAEIRAWDWRRQYCTNCEAPV